MKVQTRAPSRAGLAGNPSDGYGGRAVAVAITGFEARATIEPTAGVHISSALGVKQAGSGGAVVGAHDGDPARLQKLKRAYDQIGARFLAPGVWRAPTAGSTPADANRPSSPHPPNRETGETGFA